MSIDSNKDLVCDFFARFSTSDIPGALELMTGDATWWIAGKSELLPAAGGHTKEQIARMFYRMVGEMKDGQKMSVKTLVAEGD